MRVHQILRMKGSKVVTVAPHITIDALAHRLMLERIGAVPVVNEDGRVVGIVSERDLALVEALPGVDPAVVLVEEAMTGDPRVVAADAPLVEVVELLAEHKYGAAVVTEERRLAGIFTTVDALRVFAQGLRGG